MLKWADQTRKIGHGGNRLLRWVILLACLIGPLGLGLPSGSRAGTLDFPLDFSVHTLSSEVPGNTALIVGGIQGDEPGGFNAAALIATHYKILSGRVIAVPNLNFSSIVRRSRGIYGDMNRKFDRLNETDPEHRTIDRIKSMILDSQVDFVLNLHDGSGFYTPVYESPQRHPDRWGQSIIIDQAAMPPGKKAPLFTDLARVAGQCARSVNTRLQDPSHVVYVKNTHTAQGNREMAKTLTFFALKHNKPAFGIEASKAFLTPGRVYYHLLAIEAFLERANIKFERGFDLTHTGIQMAMDQGIALSLGGSRVLVFAENIRNCINFIPMEKKESPDFYVNHPLLTLVPNGKVYNLFHGNRRLTRLVPQYFEYDFGLEGIEMMVDGKTRSVPFGSRIPVKERFLVKHIPEHRVNIIGFSKQGEANESGFVVRKQNFTRQFSLDRGGEIFRVEVYKGDKFNGMVLVDFRTMEKPFKLAGLENDYRDVENAGR